MAPRRVAKGKRLTKEIIRRECLERIKKDRQTQIWRIRQQEVDVDMEEGARRVLDQVLTESSMEEYIELSPEDEAELMTELEAELNAWYQEADSYAEQLEAETRNLENTVSQYEEEAVNPADSILCPVCTTGSLRLIDNRASDHSSSPPFIQCNHCLVRIADGTVSDGLSLVDLRQMLAQSYEGHAAAGCSERLSFYVDSRFGNLLVSSCPKCGFHTVLM